MDTEYDARLNPASERELLDNLVVGRDWNTPFHKALDRPARCGSSFGRFDMLAGPVLVYKRGMHAR